MCWEIKAGSLSEIAAMRMEFPYNIWWENNYQMHKEYPQLQVLTDILQNGADGRTAGMRVIYRKWKLPIGSIIVASIFTHGEHSGNLLVDPNVIYKNGYNVLRVDEKNDDILKALICPLYDGWGGLIIRMAKGCIRSQDEEYLRNLFPECTYDVFKMVDFSGIFLSSEGNEMLSDYEWSRLVENLAVAIPQLQYRARIAQYRNPDDFKLISDDKVVPVMDTEPFISMMKPKGSGKVMVDYKDGRVGEWNMFEMMREKWNDILMHIKEKHNISDVSFSTLLLPLRLYGMDEFNGVKIIVPDVNYIDNIKKKYGPMFKTSIEDVVHETCEIEFITEEQAVDKCMEASLVVDGIQVVHGKKDEPKEPQRFFDQIYKASLGLLIGALVESKALKTQDIFELYEVLRKAEEYEL